jgi:HEAT repeats
MRKSIFFLVIFLFGAAQGCGGPNPGPNPAPPRGVLNNPQEQSNLTTPTPDKGYDKNPAAVEGVSEFIAVKSAESLIWPVIPFVEFIHWIEGSRFHTAQQAARGMENKDNADDRREGIIELVTEWDFARKPPLTTRYKEIAQNDPDFTVRAMAIRALNISRDASATEIFISALDDDNELIRLEGAKALANVPDPAAIPSLERLLEGKRVSVSKDGESSVPTDESLDVRIAAADALRQYRDLDVARNLVAYLNEREFAVAWQSRQSLTVLTGRDLQYDQAAWLAYLTGPERPLR